MGILILVIGGLSAVVAGAMISHDLTPKEILGLHYAYGTTGHPELMTAHEWGMIIWLGSSLLVAGLGVVMALGAGVGAVASFAGDSRNAK